MTMKWRVTTSEWKPDQMTLMDRKGSHLVDQEENRRRLTAYELNAQIGMRGCWHLIDSLMPYIEKQARHVGVWGRLKACIAQLRNMQMAMLDHVSMEQLLSIKNNTQHMKLSMTPEMLPGEPEMIIQPLKEHNRLLCAALAYCEQHCDGSQCAARGCKIKKLLDESCYMQDCDFPVLVPGTCRYSMADVDWAPIKKE